MYEEKGIPGKENTVYKIQMFEITDILEFTSLRYGIGRKFLIWKELVKLIAPCLFVLILGAQNCFDLFLAFI